MSLSDLSSYLRESGGTQWDMVVTLIGAAIESGTSRGPDIVATIADLGFDARYVGIQLRSNCGPNPARHRWRKAEDGRYHLH